MLLTSVIAVGGGMAAAKAQGPSKKQLISYENIRIRAGNQTISRVKIDRSKPVEWKYEMASQCFYCTMVLEPWELPPKVLGTVLTGMVVSLTLPMPDGRKTLDVLNTPVEFRSPIHFAHGDELRLTYTLRVEDGESGVALAKPNIKGIHYRIR